MKIQTMVQRSSDEVLPILSILDALFQIEDFWQAGVEKSLFFSQPSHLSATKHPLSRRHIYIEQCVLMFSHRALSRSMYI